MGQAASASVSSTTTDVPKVPPPANDEEHPACSACAEPSESDAVRQAKAQEAGANAPNGRTPFAYMHSGCPLNRRELGRSSWALLHTMANYYPEKPTRAQQDEMAQFVESFIRLYPCGYCGDTSYQDMMRNPPKLKTRLEFARWMCEMHNDVNHRLGKPEFDCNLVEQRWRTGPPDGSCNNT